VCGCIPAIEPDPTRTTPALVSAMGTSIIIRSTVNVAQTFGVAKDAFEFAAVELRGLYPTGMSKETISIGVFGDAKGAPDPAKAYWTHTYALGETRFAETDSTKPAAAAANVFVVDKPFKVAAGEVYWLMVATSASSVSMLAYDGSQLGGDAIRPGDLYLSKSDGTWSMSTRGDLHMVVNPCSGGVISF
jgi:hypothetical protein